MWRNTQNANAVHSIRTIFLLLSINFVALILCVGNRFLLKRKRILDEQIDPPLPPAAKNWQHNFPSVLCEQVYLGNDIHTKPHTIKFFCRKVDEGKMKKKVVCVYIYYTIQSQWKLRCAVFRYIEDSTLTQSHTHIEHIYMRTHLADSWALCGLTCVPKLLCHGSSISTDEHLYETALSSLSIFSFIICYNLVAVWFRNISIGSVHDANN